MMAHQDENAARGMLHAVTVAAGMWLLIGIVALAVGGI